MIKVNADKSTPLVIKWLKEYGFKIIDEFNDGKEYPDRNGKLHNKKNLGCDFWIEEEGEMFTVECKMSWSEKCTLNVKLHQVDRLKEGGIMISVKELKDKTLDFIVKTWDDISDETKRELEILGKLKLRCVSVIEIRWK